MATTIRYILLTAFRDWLFIGLLFAMGVVIGVSNFLGDTALTEEGQMTISYILGSTRLVILTGLIIFVCFHVRRSFENREVEMILSRPISRGTYVLAYWMGFAVVALFLVVPLVAALSFFEGVNIVGLLYWGGSLLLECFLIVAFSLFSALLLRSAVTSVLLCFGFYVMARMMGFFVYILEKPTQYDFWDINGMVDRLLHVFSMLIPRLDLFSQTKWVVYGMEWDFVEGIFIPQAVIYIGLLLFMAAYDFKRREF